MQKAAYEMRISEWSSDVCSSDLSQELLQAFTFHRREPAGILERLDQHRGRSLRDRCRERAVWCGLVLSRLITKTVDGNDDFSFRVGQLEQVARRGGGWRQMCLRGHTDRFLRNSAGRQHYRQGSARTQAQAARSEEHTSALQSLMRIS